MVFHPDDRRYGQSAEIRIEPVQRGSPRFEAIALPVHVAAQDPPHFGLAADRRLKIPLEVEETDMSDGRTIGSPLSRPQADPEHTPEAGAGHRAAPRILAGLDPANMASHFLVGMNVGEIVDVWGLQMPKHESLGLERRGTVMGKP